MTIIGGHQRLTVAMELGYTEVPCAVVDIDKTREKALNIALNKITGAWDDSLLADLLKDLEDSNFDLGKTGFEPPEISELFTSVHDKDVKDDDFDVESELKQPCFPRPEISGTLVNTQPSAEIPRTRRFIKICWAIPRLIWSVPMHLTSSSWRMLPAVSRMMIWMTSPPTSF